MASSTAPLASGFSRFMFVTGKWVSVFFAILAFLTFIITVGLVMISYVSGGFETPKFSKNESKVSERSVLQENSVQAQKEKLEINSEYGRDILEIISKHKIANVQTDQLVDFMVNLDKKYRSKFVKGLRKYLADGMDAMEDEKRVQDGTSRELTFEYINHFKTSIEMEGSNDASRESSRMMYFGIMLGSMCLLIIALILPVLVQVERNTRPQAMKLANLPEEKVVPVTPVEVVQEVVVSCPKCGTINDPANAFCENCGESMQSV